MVPFLSRIQATFLLALALLVGCDTQDPVVPPSEGALTFAIDGAPAIRAGTLSVNDEVAGALRVTNTSNRELVVAQACGAPAWTLQKDDAGTWRTVAIGPCAQGSAPRPVAPGDTLVVRLSFTLADLDAAALPGRYRVALDVRRADGTALPDSARTSAPFSVADAATTPAPVLFAPGVVASGQEEWRVPFTPRGDTAYFARSAAFFPASRQATVYETRLVDGTWTPPVVASFSGVYPDIDPFVSPDGRRLFFSSIRPVGGQPRSDLDLWVVERTGTGWSAPVHLGAVNSSRDELYASVDAAGVLYVASDRPGGVGGFDIYRASPSGAAYGPAENVGAPVNTPVWQFNPTVTSDGNTLVFTGLNYAGGAGAGDLYVTTRSGATWDAPRSVGSSVNTSADEFHPSFAPDGRHFFFIRRLSQGDPYMVSWPLP